MRSYDCWVDVERLVDTIEDLPILGKDAIKGLTVLKYNQYRLYPALLPTVYGATLFICI